jgi:lysophospholipase L1-like esterase
MNKLLLILFLCLITLFNAQGQVYKTSFFDFGPNDVTNGNPTQNPDANGNYWNNITDPNTTAAAVNLVDVNNQSTGSSLVITGALARNGIQTGGLLSPSATLLKQFAIPTATQDYFYTSTAGSITLKGLNKSRGYVFSLFATRNDPETRITTYSIQGNNSFTGTLKTSGTNLGGNGYNGNNSTILVMPTVTPNSNGEVVITITRTAGAFAYLGILKMEEVDIVYKTWFVDFGPNDVSNGNSTPSPDANGINWNNATNPNTSAPVVLLKDVKNQTTPATLSVSTTLLTNGIQNGGLLAPASAALKQFAVATVTQDYFYTPTSGSIIFKGLDKTRGYIFSLFGTRNDPENRTTTYTLLGANQYSGTLQTSGTNLGGTGYNGNNSSVLVTKTMMPNSNGELVLVITKTAGSFAYLGALKMDEVNGVGADSFCKTKDNLKIAWMGSSVAFGQGATNSQGHAYLYTQQLKNRYTSGKGKNWNVSNISVPGNNTIAVLNRWNSDLLPQCSKYVVYGLSLGNEGIIGGGQQAFDQFRDNMQLLINKARLEGIEPIISNVYTRNDYTATEYNYVKQMNALINSWNVASINLLGAVDNGSGQWAPGYFFDALHPNDLGHREIEYAIVPSLFDALDAGKPQPHIVNGTSLAMSTSGDFKLEITPEETLHSFTYSFDVKTSAAGTLGELQTTTGVNALSIAPGSGKISYTSTASTGLTGATAVTNNQWHKVTLTHYYAWGRTLLYVDNVLQGAINEKIITTNFTLGGETSPLADYRNLLVYRSAINAGEVATLVSNQLLKSSLEIYSPLDAQGITGSDTLINLAQCMNKVIKRKMNAACTVNLSLNKAATATGQCNANEAPSFAVDGNATTKWCTGTAGDKWLEINLGQETPICSWYVQHAGNESINWITNDFKLQRKSGSTWIDVDAVTGNTSNTNKRFVTPFTAQNVRLYITKPEYNNANGVARIYEFSVFGTTQNITTNRAEETAETNETLFYNAPNPFNVSTRLTINQQSAGEASVVVYSKTGELIQTIFEGYLTAGMHEFVFDGFGLRSDLYVVKYRYDGGVIIRKVLKSE